MKKRLLLLFLCAVCLLAACDTPEPSPEPRPDGGTTLATLTSVTFSIGKADATLIYRNDFAILIDTGEDEDGAEILRYIERKGIRRIDALILTHFDKDHVGGADHILRGTEVGAIYATYKSKESEEYDQYIAAATEKGLTPVTVRERLSLTFGDARVTVLPPEKTGYEVKESNNSSLAVHLSYGERAFLYAADAQEARLAELISTEGIAADVLKVPYHGEDVTNLPEFLAHVKPQYGVITCSDKNPEVPEKTADLRAANVGIYLTRFGNVTFTTDGERLAVTQ